MTQSQITKLEKEIERKIQVNVQPAKSRKDYRIDAQKLKKLAKKIREFESQPDAIIVR